MDDKIYFTDIAHFVQISMDLPQSAEVVSCFLDAVNAVIVKYSQAYDLSLNYHFHPTNIQISTLHCIDSEPVKKDIAGAFWQLNLPEFVTASGDVKLPLRGNFTTTQAFVLGATTRDMGTSPLFHGSHVETYRRSLQPRVARPRLHEYIRPEAHPFTIKVGIPEYDHWFRLVFHGLALQYRHNTKMLHDKLNELISPLLGVMHKIHLAVNSTCHYYHSNNDPQIVKDDLPRPKLQSASDTTKAICSLWTEHIATMFEHNSKYYNDLKVCTDWIQERTDTGRIRLSEDHMVPQYKEDRFASLSKFVSLDNSDADHPLYKEDDIYNVAKRLDEYYHHAQEKHIYLNRTVFSFLGFALVFLGIIIGAMAYLPFHGRIPVFFVAGATISLFAAFGFSTAAALLPFRNIPESLRSWLDPDSDYNKAKKVNRNPDGNNHQANEVDCCPDNNVHKANKVGRIENKVLFIMIALFLSISFLALIAGKYFELSIFRNMLVVFYFVAHAALFIAMFFTKSVFCIWHLWYGWALEGTKQRPLSDFRRQALQCFEKEDGKVVNVDASAFLNKLQQDSKRYERVRITSSMKERAEALLWLARRRCRRMALINRAAIMYIYAVMLFGVAAFIYLLTWALSVA